MWWILLVVGICAIVLTIKICAALKPENPLYNIIAAIISVISLGMVLISILSLAGVDIPNVDSYTTTLVSELPQDAMDTEPIDSYSHEERAGLETVPPVTETASPVTETTPPVTETTPPVTETTPPVTEMVLPPIEFEDTSPPMLDIEPTPFFIITEVHGETIIWPNGYTSYQLGIEFSYEGVSRIEISVHSLERLSEPPIIFTSNSAYRERVSYVFQGNFYEIEAVIRVSFILLGELYDDVVHIRYNTVHDQLTYRVERFNIPPPIMH